MPQQSQGRSCTFDEVHAMHVENAELIGVCLTAAAHLPGRATDDELVTRQVQRDERGPSTFFI